MNDTLSSIIEGSLRGVFGSLYNIFDDLHLSDEEEAEIRLKFKKAEDSFFLEMISIDNIIQAIACNSIAQSIANINVLISYARDHPGNENLSKLLKTRQKLVDAMNENQK